MHVLNGHFEGRKLVLDDPLPDDVPPNAKARITIDSEVAPKPSSLERIAKMAVSGRLPRDFSTNFKHYTKGTPRR